MARHIAGVTGVGIKRANFLDNEILPRHLRDGKAVARYAGLTGSPDESGKRRREQGLARAGNARVRRGMIQLAWRADAVILRGRQNRGRRLSRAKSNAGWIRGGWNCANGPRSLETWLSSDLTLHPRQGGKHDCYFV